MPISTRIETNALQVRTEPCHRQDAAFVLRDTAPQEDWEKGRAQQVDTGSKRQTVSCHERVSDPAGVVIVGNKIGADDSRCGAGPQLSAALPTREAPEPHTRAAWAHPVGLKAKGKGGIQLFLVAAGLALAAPAAAAPPPGVDLDSPAAKWVQRWHNAERESCCGIDSDCRPTWVRPTQLGAPSGWDAWIDRETYGPTAPDDWRPAPRKAIGGNGDENPTGTGWACWFDKEVRCVSPASGS